MAEILNDEKIQSIIMTYYKEHFGERATDFWYPSSAVNVYLFRRDGKLITLHCHPFSGEVKAKIRDMD